MRSKYYIAALSAFGIWGFFSLVLKPLHAYRSVDILFYRVFICATLMLLINVLFRRKVLRQNFITFKALTPKQKRTLVLVNLGGGALLTANWFFFIYVMNHISIKAASFAYLVCPILTTVLAFLILRESLSQRQWLAVALSLFSCLLLSFHNLADIGYSMIVALSYALYLIIQRKNTGLDKFLTLSCQLIFSALLLLPFYPAYGTLIADDLFFYAQVALIAVLFTIVPLYLNLYALQGLRSSTIGILLYINPLLNFFIAVLYYNETISSIQLLSYLIIMVSIVIFNSRLLFSRRLSNA